MTTIEARLPAALLALRLGVFVVMIVWTLDKFVNPAHTAGVFAAFYRIEGLTAAASYAVGAVQLVIVLAFVAGVARRWSYGAVLVLHGISTLSSFPRYLEPFDNLLFFAAWPMLAACWALYWLRDADTLASVSGAGARSSHPR